MMDDRADLRQKRNIMPFEKVFNSTPRSDVIQIGLARLFAQDVVEREGRMPLDRRRSAGSLPRQYRRIAIHSHI